MLVVQAKHKGMCFGVRDALDMMRGLENPDRVTVHGELVHNPVVQTELMRRGFHQQKEVGRTLNIPTPEVLITAHGVSDTRKRELLESGYTLHDTTCPLVRRAHKACLHYHNRGYYIVLVGRKGHVEVEGLAGDLRNYEIVSRLDEPMVMKILVANLGSTSFNPTLTKRSRWSTRPPPAPMNFKSFIIACSNSIPARMFSWWTRPASRLRIARRLWMTFSPEFRPW